MTTGTVQALPGEAMSGIGPSGGRIGTAEVTIVGGNVASARERALGEALKQAVDQELSVVVPDARTTQGKTVSQVLGRARRYVRRYRTLEEGELRRGLYSVRIEADVDDTALLRAFDKIPPGVAANPGAGPGGVVTPSYFLVGAGAPEAAAAAARAFTATGARVEMAPPDMVEPARALEAALRAGIPAVAFVSGTAIVEGEVRGPAVQAVTCTVGVRVLTSGSGLAVADESETIRGFADKVETARADCFARAAATAVPRVFPSAVGRATPDLRAIVIDADVIEPGAVPGMLKQLREIGSVSAVEVRRIAPGRVELWARTRLTPNALVATLTHDTGGEIVFDAPEVTGDLVRLRARLRDSGGLPAGTARAPTSGAVPSQPAPTPLPAPSAPRSAPP